jgi:hypothetical protein
MTYNKEEFEKLAARDEFEVGHYIGRHLVCPREVAHITKAQAKSGVYKGINQMYEHRSLAVRGCGMFLSSAITQMRLVFAISGAVISEAIQRDPNIPDRNSPLSSKEIKEVLSEFLNNYGRILQNSKATDSNTVGECGILLITDTKIQTLVSKALGLSVEEVIEKQLKEVQEFIRNYTIGQWAKRVSQSEYKRWVEQNGRGLSEEQMDALDSKPYLALKAVLKVLHDRTSGNELALEEFKKQVAAAGSVFMFNIAFYFNEIWNSIESDKVERLLQRSQKLRSIKVIDEGEQKKA